MTAVSANTGLIATPEVDYTSANATGKLRFSPQADQYGVTTITVTVEDAGSDNKLETSFDNLLISKTFEVEVTPVNDAQRLALLIISLWMRIVHSKRLIWPVLLPAAEKRKACESPVQVVTQRHDSS